MQRLVAQLCTLSTACKPHDWFFGEEWTTLQWLHVYVLWTLQTLMYDWCVGYNLIKTAVCTVFTIIHVLALWGQEIGIIISAEHDGILNRYSLSHFHAVNYHVNKKQTLWYKQKLWLNPTFSQIKKECFRYSLLNEPSVKLCKQERVVQIFRPFHFIMAVFYGSSNDYLTQDDVLVCMLPSHPGSGQREPQKAPGEFSLICLVWLVVCVSNSHLFPTQSMPPNSHLKVVH